MFQDLTESEISKLELAMFRARENTRNLVFSNPRLAAIYGKHIPPGIRTIDTTQDSSGEG